MEQAGQPYPIFMLNDSLKATFTLKEPVKNAKLYYVTTGHGGWGNGDEFNQKPNTIYLDGEKSLPSFRGETTAELTETGIPAPVISPTDLVLPT